MDSEMSGLDSELSETLLEGLVSALSAAATLQYSRELYVYLEQLQAEIRSASGDNSNVAGLSNEAKQTKLEDNCALLMIVIEQIRERLGPACAKSSRNAMERLKRLISSARKHILIVRDLLDVENPEND